MARGTTPDRFSGRELPGVRPRNKRGIPTLTPAVPEVSGGVGLPLCAAGVREEGPGGCRETAGDGPVPFRC